MTAPGGAPRIVLDGRMLFYSRTGIGRYLRHLYPAMAALGPAGLAPPGLASPRDQCTVLYSRRDRRRALGQQLPRAAVAWTPAHHPAERWTLAAEGLPLRPRLWHAPDHVCPQPLGWRTVLTVHDLAFWRFPETHTPASRAYYAGLWRSVAQATRVICVSHATRRDLLAATGVAGDKVRVVYEAPDPRFAPSVTGAAPRVPPDGAPDGAPYFLCVGSIEPRKNLAALFRALARLPQAARPELRVVGASGAGAAAITTLPAQLGLAPWVRFLGPLPTADVARLYRGALALVYPSLLEGFGLPILEAMAAGAPVIAADRSSIPEVAGDAAVLIDPEDEDAFAAALEHVASSPELRATLRQRGALRAAQFTWERAARETLAVFAEALQA